MASSEAIAFCDVDNFSGPEIECDASTLTEDEWQKRRAHTIGGSDCAAIFGENKYNVDALQGRCLTGSISYQGQTFHFWRVRPS